MVQKEQGDGGGNGGSKAAAGASSWDHSGLEIFMRRASRSSFRERTGLLQLRKGQDARVMIDDAEHSVADTRVRGSWAVQGVRNVDSGGEHDLYYSVFYRFPRVSIISE